MGVYLSFISQINCSVTTCHLSKFHTNVVSQRAEERNIRNKRRDVWKKASSPGGVWRCGELSGGCWGRRWGLCLCSFSCFHTNKYKGCLRLLWWCCDVRVCHRRRKKADGRRAELREVARNAEETQLCSDTVSVTHTDMCAGESHVTSDTSHRFP